MECSNYIIIRVSYLSADFFKQYNIQEKVTKDGYVYIEVFKGMHGLPQAGTLSQELLEKLLNEKGYRQIARTPGLCTHAWIPI